jgi:crotonobetainyl-CoA:carnitine CoA-transferase CaiB-like acyl-CoA transferase
LLKDIRVLDLADETGSFCSRLLADLGASVIKVEKPGGDRSRKIGPFLADRPGPENSLFFAYHNANKLGITLDINQKADRETFLGLVKDADILVETFQPGYLETIGLGFETLRTISPGFIHLAITGFGQKGPGKNHRSCDLVASASGGQMYIMGGLAGRPQAPFGEQSYYSASLFGAVQVLLALSGRDQTGKGTYIDLSLQEAVASTLDYVMVRWFYEKTVTKRQGNLYGNSFFCIMPTKDGHIQLTLLQQWETLVELMAAEGMAQDLTDAQWQDEAYRIDHVSHIIEVVGKWTGDHTTEELFSLGQAMRFPWAPLCSLKDVLKSPQLQARKFFMPLDGPGGSMKIPCPGLPCKFSSFPQAPIRRAPLLGEHYEALSSGTAWPQRTASRQIFPIQSELTTLLCPTGHPPNPLPSLERRGIVGEGNTGNSPPPPYQARGRLCPPSSYPEGRAMGRNNAVAVKRHGESSSSKHGTMDRGVLANMRVLDFTWMLAGPYATRILADCGAEVIKVQSAKTAKGAETNVSGYFNTWNRNKRSITLDLSHPEARDIILNLTAASDIVVENFSPRVMPNWGLSYNALKEVKPNVIMASISAMGQTGPWKDYTGYGPTFHALSGLTSMTSSGQTSPIGLGHAYADTIIGLYAALAILTAMKHRDTTGAGQYIDIAGYEAICTLLGPALLHAGINKNPILSDDDEPTAPYGCYRCAGDDKWCVIAIFNENDWHTFCRLLGNPGWTRERAFSTSSQRRENRAALDCHIETWTCMRNPKTVVDLLQNHSITAGIIENAEDLAKDPCLLSRNFFTKLIHPVLGKTISDRSALTFSKDATDKWKTASLLGEDNQYVFIELLGFTEEEFLSSVERGIIG